MAEIITNQMTKTRISGVRFVDEDAPKMTRYSLADKMAENEPKLEYHVKTITVDDKPKVLSFLRRFFFRDEPLNYSIRLIPDGEDSTCIELEDYSMSCVEENLCLMAVSPAGAVVGVMLSGIIPGVTEKIEDDDEPSYIKLCTSPKFQKIQRLLYRVEKDVDLLNKYPNKKCVDVKIISVDSNWRGKGIAGTMLEKTIDMCKGLGYDLLRTDCSSHFTAKLCKSFGFEKIYELKYSDYLDENGKPVFTPEQPHNAMTTWIKML